MMWILLASLLVGGCGVQAQSPQIGLSVGPTAPPNAQVGDLWSDTTAGALKRAASIGPLTWDVIGGGGSALPSGLIVFLASGTCPAGYTEVSGLDGRMPLGTVAANANVGTTGGSDTLTPAGTNSAPTFTGTLASLTHTGANVTSAFTGSALATHAHELPWQIATATTIRQIAVATFGTGTSRAATAVSAAGTANTTSAAVALSQAVSAGTPAGTVANTITQAGAHSYTPQGSVSAPAFTGTSADNRSAWIRLIGCQKT